MATMITETSIPATETPESTHHSASRRHKKRESDPFLELPDSIIPPPDAPSKGEADTDKNESLLTKIFLTPVLMVSFLLSISFVDHQQRAWRLSQHYLAPASWFSSISIWSWIDPEPYQDPQDSTWNQGRDDVEHHDVPAGGGVPEALRPDDHQWHTNKKHRKMAKMEVGDAFEMRDAVLAMMAVCAIICLASLIWMLRTAYRWLT